MKTFGTSLCELVQPLVWTHQSVLRLPKNSGAERRLSVCQLQVGFEELASSLRQHLTSFTNKWSSCCFKVRLICFGDLRRRTPGFWILRKVPSPWKPSGAPPPRPPLEPRGPGGVFNFINIHSFILGILAANPGLYYWMDVLLCHREPCLKLNF